jgi:hypothetical protein
VIYWLQEATQTGAEGALSSWTSVLLTNGVVGAVVGLVGVLIGQVLQQRRHSQTLRETQRRHSQTLEQTAELEAQRAHEAALQKYLEQAGQWLLEHPVRDAPWNDNLRAVARAQTLAVLEGLDPARKRILLQFLFESNLIVVHAVISLLGANLIKANLSHADLHGADLTGANLSEANLCEAGLTEANLSGAKLTGANVRGAHLSRSNMRMADLSEANLSGAIVSGADLLRAILRETNLSKADLRGADLRGAEILTQKQIDQADGDKDTTLPDHLQRPAHWSKGDEVETEES